MMKKFRNFFSNILTLTILLALGVGVALFLSSRAQTSQPAAQATETTATPAPTAETKPTTTPAITATLLPQPPQDDTPEPTWTPVIVLPDAPQPTDPPRLPTPTPTPVNPSESELISFDVPASVGAISPDGKTLAFDILQVKTNPGINPYNQVWKLDLDSKQATKLVEHGASPIWSPNGQSLAYQLFSPTGEIEEVRIIGADGRNEKSLGKSQDLLGYYWLASDQVGLIQIDGIHQVDLTGKEKGKVSLNLPPKSKGSNFKPKVTGHSNNVVLVADGQDLSFIQSNGQVITIRDDKGWQIFDFRLSPDGKQVVYTTSYGPEEALWLSDLTGKDRQKLFERIGDERGHIRALIWSPDSKAAVFGWSNPGTSQYLNLAWVDIKSGKVTPLGVDNVDFSGLAFSPDGQYLYYTRLTQMDDAPWGKSTLYQLKVK
ncbi:MAG: hypothetical protein U0401_03660 [Anaerolineae bacterium]